MAERAAKCCGALVLVLAIAVALVMPTLWQMLHVAAGFSARMYCSIRFVQGRVGFDTTWHNAPPEFEGLVRVIMTRGTTTFEEMVDGRVTHARVTTSLLWGRIVRVALYRPDTGCTLAGDDVDMGDTDYTDNATAIALADRNQQAAKPKFMIFPFEEQHDPWPQGARPETWDERVARESVLSGVDRNALERAFDLAFAEKPIPSGSMPRINTYGAAVAYRGILIGERYASDTPRADELRVDVNTRVHGWSISKTLLSALIGARIQYEPGARYMLDDPLNDAHMATDEPLPVFDDDKTAAADAATAAEAAAAAAAAADKCASPAAPDSAAAADTKPKPWLRHVNSNITVRDALYMSTGLEFQEKYSMFTLYDPSRMLFGTYSHARYASSKPLAHPHGTHWSYSSGTSNLLARHFRLTFKDDEEMRWWTRDFFFVPLRMRTALIESDAAGDFVASSFSYASVRDWLRFGQMFLNGGKSLDGQNTQLLAPGWAHAMLTEVAPACKTSRKCGRRRISEGDKMDVDGGQYGRHVWFGGFPGSRHPRIRSPCMLALGYQGQVIAVVPAYDLVVVRFGLSYDERDFPLDDYVNAVIDALPPPTAATATAAAKPQP